MTSSVSRKECLFCRIVDGEIPADVIISNEVAVAIRDVAPVAPTHALVIPREHYANAAELARQAPILLAQMIELAEAVRELDSLDAYRLVFNTGALAGQSVFHVHLHVIGGRPLQWPPG